MHSRYLFLFITYMVSVNALTYNISFATQINKAIGSESDFVEACQKHYSKGGIQCTKDAVANIGKLPALDIVGLQELNSDIEKKIMKVQPSLTKYHRGTAGIATVSVLWNEEIFGKVIHEKVFNLVDKDSRPCLILVMQNGFVVVNLHMPHGSSGIRALRRIKREINNDETIRRAFYNDDSKIIMFGDFNDSKTSISRHKPLALNYRNKTVRLKYNKTRNQARKTLRSCCWHKPGHKYKYFDSTGDYILVNRNIIQKSIKIPSIFKVRGRNNRLFSDHMPVLAKLVFREN